MTKKQLKEFEIFKMDEQSTRTDLHQSQMLRVLKYYSWSYFIWKDGNFIHTSEMIGDFRDHIAINKTLPENCYTSNRLTEIITYLGYAHEIEFELIKQEKPVVKVSTKDYIIGEKPLDINEYRGYYKGITIALEYLTITKQFTRIK